MMFTRENEFTSSASDVTVVIRSTGERTLQMCLQFLCEQVPPENVVIINEFPFRRAAQRSFEIGIKLGRTWTLCLDADILLRRTAVQTLLNWGCVADNNVLYVQGAILDKIFGGPRRAGPYLHRTSLLPEMLEYMPADGVSLRPDTDAAVQLAALGYIRLQKDQIIALHDFEQYYRDIYRKAFVHAHKHDHEMARLEPLWQGWADQDSDYQVALWGLQNGRLQSTVSHDVRCFPQDISSLLRTKGLQEKEVLKLTEIGSWDVDKMIAHYYRTRALAHHKFPERKIDLPRTYTTSNKG